MIAQRNDNDGEAAQADRERDYDLEDEAINGEIDRVLRGEPRRYTGGYENAPATRMLATHCAACGRPLVDANSVEAGMGPDCRERYGYGDAVGEEARAEANAAIHYIALKRSNNQNTGMALAIAAYRLRELGLPRLSDRVLKTAAPIQISSVNGTYTVKTPYSPEAVAILRTVPGRRWDGVAKINTFPASSRAALYRALIQAFPGEVAVCGTGVFQLPVSP